MKILVTGSAGFIGFHLSRSLLDVGHDVLGIDNINNYYDVGLKKSRLKILKKNKNFTFKRIDIKNYNSLSKIFDFFSPDKVVNLAAQAGVRYSIQNPFAYMDSNLVGFLNIIELCRHKKVDGLVYASSSSVYGGNVKIPFSVEDRVDNPISLYAATKKSNELIANSYSTLFGLNTIGLRYFTVYGPWGRPDMAMYIFADKIKSDLPIPVFNYGKMKRDFTFIDDIISGTKSAIDVNYNCEVFNLGNNNSEDLMKVISILEREIGKKAKIEFLPMQPGDVSESFAEISKSKKMLNYSPKTNINEGIAKFINWHDIYTNEKKDFE